MFVTFEGPEGAGKSTTLKAISQRLEDLGKSVLSTREPGAGEFGLQIRKILLDGGELPIESELFLFLADRANHIQNIVLPAIKEGKIVLCDRHTDSTLVYQGYGRGMPLDQLKSFNLFATRGVKPDLTLLFDLDPKIGLSRRGEDRNRLDNEPLDFHTKVREGFLTLSKEEPDRIKIINADAPPETVLNAAWQYLEPLI
jgi:dTMP kinase